MSGGDFRIAVPSSIMVRIHPGFTRTVAGRVGLLGVPHLSPGTPSLSHVETL